MTELKQNFSNPRVHAAEAMGRIRNLHFIGIGGSGMNGIAQVMLNLGYQVSGSDLHANAATQRLAEQGATLFIGHEALHVQGADAVITSSAVKEDNPEVMAARAARIPVVPRAEMLAEIMRFRFGVAIAGTHGKTTTTSLTASLLIEGGLDPTFVIGGKLNSAGSYAHLGSGEILVAEADESDASFLYLQPMIAIVTNVDQDHMSTYGGDFSKLQDTFVEFLHHLPFYGLAVLCMDDPQVRALLPRVARPVLGYGLDTSADIRAENIHYRGHRTHFDLCRKDGTSFPVSLNLPGRHNVLNALAACAVALEMGVSVSHIQNALVNFQGIGRRFQSVDDCLVGGRRVMLVDDYGHHPSEIAATLAAAREGWPGRRIVLAFQPHRYSRTQDLFDDFCQVLSSADVLLLAEVYAAGELPISGADGRSLSRAVRARGRINPMFVDSVQEMPDMFHAILKEGDILLLMGAGDIGQVANRLREACQPCCS